MCLDEFRRAGRILADAGLVQSSSGNMSIRSGEDIFVTRSGSNLANLSTDDIVKTGINEDYRGCFQPSSEIEVHRTVYRQTRWLAVVHTHLPWAITLSLTNAPMPESVNVVGSGGRIVPGIWGDEIALALKSSGLVMVKDHGSFAGAGTLAEACKLTLDFEQRCREQASLWGLPLQSVSE